MTKEEILEIYSEFVNCLNDIPELTRKNSIVIFYSMKDHQNISLTDIIQPIRFALTGKIVSPPIDEVMEVLGKEKVIERINNCKEFFRDYISAS